MLKPSWRHPLYETSVLIGVDNSMLDTYTSLRVGKEKKLRRIKSETSLVNI